MTPNLDEIEAELRKRANRSWEKSNHPGASATLAYAYFKAYEELNDLIRWLDQQRKETER